MKWKYFRMRHMIVMIALRMIIFISRQQKATPLANVLTSLHVLFHETLLSRCKTLSTNAGSGSLRKRICTCRASHFSLPSAACLDVRCRAAESTCTVPGTECTLDHSRESRYIGTLHSPQTVSLSTCLNSYPLSLRPTEYGYSGATDSHSPCVTHCAGVQRVHGNDCHGLFEKAGTVCQPRDLPAARLMVGSR